MQPFSCIMGHAAVWLRINEQKDRTMYDIRHRIGVAGTPAAVYQQLATTDGLKAWWTSDVRGNAEAGEKLSFHFNTDERGIVEDRSMVMEVVELRDGERVAWRCVEG